MRDFTIVLAASVATLVLRSAVELEASPYILGVLGIGIAGFLFRKIKTYRM